MDAYQSICITGEKNVLRNVCGKRVCIIADIVKSAQDGLLVRIQCNAPTRWAEHPRYFKSHPNGSERFGRWLGTFSEFMGD